MGKRIKLSLVTAVAETIRAENQQHHVVRKLERWEYPKNWRRRKMPVDKHQVFKAKKLKEKIAKKSRKVNR